MVSKPKLRVFLDTNVIFSGLYSSRGAPGAILKHFIEGRISVVVSSHLTTVRPEHRDTRAVSKAAGADISLKN